MPRVERDIVVQAPAENVYQVWHNFENFPSFMENIEEVRCIDDRRSHWRAKGPLGQHAEWDAEVTTDEPRRRIAWRSIEGSGNVRTAGEARFEELDGATRVRVTMEYEPQGGLAGEVAAKIFANPDKQVEEDLHRFKEGVERDRQFAPPSQQDRQDAAERVVQQMQDDARRSPVRDHDVPAGSRELNSRRRSSSDFGHGTPGGTLGALNETDVSDPERTAEKSDDVTPRSS